MLKLYKIIIGLTLSFNLINQLYPQNIKTLRTNLIKLQAQQKQLTTKLSKAKAPAKRTIQRQIGALKKSIDKVKKSIAQATKKKPAPPKKPIKAPAKPIRKTTPVPKKAIPTKIVPTPKATPVAKPIEIKKDLKPLLDPKEAIKINLPKIDPSETNVNLKFPLIGQVNLKSTKDIKGNPISKGSINKKVDIGPLIINGGEIVLTKPNNINLNLNAQIFNKPAELSVSDIKWEINNFKATYQKQSNKLELPDIKSISLVAKFKENLNIQLLPGYFTEISFVKVILNKNTGASIVAPIVIDNNNIDLNFIYDKNNNSINLEFSLPKTTLGKVIKPLSGTLIQDIKISGTFKTTNNLNKKDFKAEFKGQVDLSSLNINLPSNQKLNLNSLEATGSFTDNNLNIVVNFEDLVVPILGKVNKASFNLKATIQPKAQVQVELNGYGNAKLLDKNIPYILESNFNPKTGLEIKGILGAVEVPDKDKKILLEPVALGNITLGTASFILNSKNQELIIKGDSNIIKELLGLGIEFSFIFNFGKTKEVIITAKAQQDQWKPFQNIKIEPIKAVANSLAKQGINDLKNLTLNNISVGFEMQHTTNAKQKTNKESKLTFKDANQAQSGISGRLFISGTTKIFNTESIVTIEATKDTKGIDFKMVGELKNFTIPKLFALSSQLNKNYKNFIEKLEKDHQEYIQNNNKSKKPAPKYTINPGKLIKDALELIQLDNAKVILSLDKTQLLFESNFGIPANSENLILKMLSDIIKISGQDPAALKLKGVFNPTSLKNLFRFSVGLTTGSFGFNVPLGNNKNFTISYGNLEFFISSIPAVGLSASVSIDPGLGTVIDGQSGKLKFQADFSFEADTFSGASSMQGKIANPLGIPKLTLGNLGFRASKRYDEIVAELSGAAGTAGISALAALVPTDYGITGEIKLDTNPVLSFSGTLNAGLDIKSLTIDAHGKNTTLVSLAQALLSILSEALKQPTLLKTDAKFPLTFDSYDIKLSPLGAYIAGIDIKPGFQLGGQVTILGHKTKLNGEANLKGIELEGNIPPIKIGDLSFTGATSSTQGPKVLVALTATDLPKIILDSQLRIGNIVNNKTILYITSEKVQFNTKASLGSGDCKINFEINSSALDFDIQKIINPDFLKNLQTNILFESNINQCINRETTKALDNIKSSIISNLDKITNQKISTQKAIETIEKDIESLRAEEKQYCDINLSITEIRQNLEKFKPLQEIAKTLGIDINKLNLIKEETIQKKPKTVGETIKQAFKQLDPKCWTPRLKLIQKEIQLAIERSKMITAKISEESKDIVNFLTEKGQIVVDKLTKIIDIKHVSWTGKLEDLANSSIQGVHVKYTIAGKEKELTTAEFNFKDPAKSISQITTQVINDLKQSITNLTQNK